MPPSHAASLPTPHLWALRVVLLSNQTFTLHSFPPPPPLPELHFQTFQALWSLWSPWLWVGDPAAAFCGLGPVYLCPNSSGTLFSWPQSQSEALPISASSAVEPTCHEEKWEETSYQRKVLEAVFSQGLYSGERTFLSYFIPSQDPDP